MKNKYFYQYLDIFFLTFSTSKKFFNFFTYTYTHSVISNQLEISGNLFILEVAAQNNEININSNLKF